MSETLAAVLWDMDGTLVDSERIWIAEQGVMVEAYGGTWTHEQGLALVGSDLQETATAMQRAGVELATDALVDALEQAVIASLRTTVPWRPGVLHLLAELRHDGVPCAIVTTSSHAMAELVAQAAPAGTFAVIVGGDDVPRTKPSPEPYLQAARLLGVPVERCVAVEDSPRGLRSAIASGAASLAVPLDAPLPAGDGFTRWTSLEGRSVADLRALLT